jgi:hypothetical protein
VWSADIAFSPSEHAREDLTVFSASFTQARQEAGIIEIECLYPACGFLTSSRWGILSVEKDGVAVEVARGEIVGFPLALTGQTVRVQLICRRPGHVELVDEIFASRDSEVPAELEDVDTPRRTEAYLLDEVYHDPVSLMPSLEPIAGSAPPVLTLYGEGAAPGQSEIFGLSAEITDAPSATCTVECQVDFEQLVYGKINAAAEISALPAGERTTFTPNALIDAAKNISLDGGYELLSASLETTPLVPLEIFTSARTVDPATCVVTRAKRVSMQEYRIDGVDLEVMVQAVQPRRERFRVSVAPLLLPFGGEADAEEIVYLTDAERRAETVKVMSYSPRPGSLVQFSKRGVGASIFTSGGAYRASIHDITDALVRRAARTAIERAHCVQLTIDTSAETAISLTLKDRIRIIDARLPAGIATGKITGIELTFGQTDSARIVIACPVSDSIDVDAVDIQYSAQEVLPEFVIDTTSTLQAVSAGDESELVLECALIDAGDVQRDEIDGTTETSVIADPEAAVPKTGLTLSLRDLTPVDVDTLDEAVISFAPVAVILPEGIRL